MARFDVVLDVETIGPEWTELDESVREYLAMRAYRDEWQKLDADRRDAIIRDGDERADRTALELGLCEVIAVGFWLVREDRGMALLRDPEDEVSRGERTSTCDVGVFRVLPEAEVLSETWRMLALCDTRGSGLRLVTFNGRSFDLPVLAIRSAQLTIRPTINPAPYRYDISEHCDLLDVLTFQGAARGMYSLDWWCRAFGIESPKAGGVDGARVGDLWRAGRLEEVATYVLGDVRAEAELYRRLATTILPHLSGGVGIDVGPTVPAGSGW